MFSTLMEVVIFSDWCQPPAEMKLKYGILLLYMTFIVIAFLFYIKDHPRSIRVEHLNKTKEFLQNLAGSNKSLTVVSGYFNIGNFPKGSVENVRTTKHYEDWIKVFERINNPVILYTDSQDFATLFADIRSNREYITKIIVINRNILWSFQIMPKIAKLYSTPGYPKHYPNTYIPAYTSLTHSKVPIVFDAIKQNYFSTDYYCWLDVGYFRDIVTRNKTFWLEIPNDFDSTKVGFTRVYDSKLSDIRPRTIIYGNLNWIGGVLFLGKPDVLMRFAKQYKSAVMRYLNESLMNVEQHILYAMYTTEERQAHPLDVDVQLYIPGTKDVIIGDPWFYLGYLMYDET